MSSTPQPAVATPVPIGQLTNVVTGAVVVGQVQQPAGKTADAEPSKGKLFAVLLLPWICGLIGCATPVLKYNVFGMSVETGFFKSCTMGFCDTGTPGGKLGVGMLFAVAFMVVHGINILVQLCGFKRSCCLCTLVIATLLIFMSFVMVVIFRKEVEDDSMGIVSYDFGPGFALLIIGSLASIGAFTFVKKTTSA